ncbi:unnamed protein product [Dracunculus medinensis]|uniref:Cullin-5 n=1 Tax=Dracunculus medinensis TaxID=318479 RepID=A0A0N4UHA1_DRAME|nr:unnamed protein product [Dracunculus medinensis]
MEWMPAKRTILALLRCQVVFLGRIEEVSHNEWQELFVIIHRICTWVVEGSRLATVNLFSEINQHVSAVYRQLQCHEDDKKLLKAYSEEWSKYYLQTEILPKPFCYISSGYINLPIDTVINPACPVKRATDEVASVSVSFISYRMLHYWNKIVFERMRARLSSASMRLIESERNGTEYSPDLIIAIRHSYISLNSNDISVYQLEFEKAYIECAEKYYKSNAPEVLETNGVKNYMTYADSRLLEEEERGHRYLDPGAHSVDKLLERLVQVIVEQFEDQILGECNSLLKSNHMDMLKKMYRLINRTSSGIPKILGCLDQYIRIEAFEEMKANVDTITTDPEKYVEQLLLMFERFTDLISVAFYDDPRFLTTRDQAFQDVVSDTRIFKIELCSSKLKAIASGNDFKHPLFSGTRVQVESKCPELLANFCDLILRKTAVSKRLNSDEVDTKLNQVLLVLKYVANKDVFMRFYKAHLTRRLILEISVDQEKEEQVVTRYFLNFRVLAKISLFYIRKLQFANC